MAGLRGDIYVRPESSGDELLVDEINLAAFNGTGEARLVRSLRAAHAVTSLVAEREGTVVGHILFTPARIGTSRPDLTVVALGPMAVAPLEQGTGVGSALVEEGISACANAGVDAIFVLGHRRYYPRFGFSPAPDRGLRFRSPQFDAHFFVNELTPGALDGQEGLVAYLPDYDEL